MGANIASTSVTYQYNSAGDLLSDGLTSYHYDSEGRLDSATTGQGPDAPTTKYAHNALGQRVFKTEPLFSSAATPGTGKNLLADDDEKGEGEQEPPGLIQQILNFWNKLWSPSTSDAEKLGWSYVYAEDGSLLGEYGSGGSASSGTSQYLYLPTASGPMPIAAVIKGQTYAIHSDHLNTPRRLTQADGQAAWQWAYSAFGEEQPTTGAKRFTNETTPPNTGATSIPEVMFNLRYPGQYFDSETKLHYNHFRSYDGRTGRYTQGDPIGLDGGWNRFGYAANNPLQLSDPSGLCIGPLLAPCLWAASNAPWLVTASTAATSFGYAYINGAAPAIAPATARLTNVARAIQEGVESGAYCSANEAGKFVNVFRAVGPDELKSIEAAGRFTNLPGLQGKYFTTSAGAAASYARQAVRGLGDPAYTIVGTQVSPNVLNQPGISSIVDRGIPAYVIPNKDLPSLVPQVLNYSPLP